MDEYTELVGFSFVSRVADGVPAAALLRLARQCFSFNVGHNLTGQLHVGGGRFSYVVEGDSRIVQSLAARILADPRHESIEIRAFHRIAVRVHAIWTLTGLDFEPPLVASAASARSLRFLPFAATGLVVGAVQGAGAL